MQSCPPLVLEPLEVPRRIVIYNPLLRSVLLNALLYPNHVASLHPDTLKQISNQCSPAAPTPQGPELGCHVNKHLGALLVCHR